MNGQTFSQNPCMRGQSHHNQLHWSHPLKGCSQVTSTWSRWSFSTLYLPACHNLAIQTSAVAAPVRHGMPTDHHPPALFVDGIPALWTWLCSWILYQRSGPGFVCWWYTSALDLALFVDGIPALWTWFCLLIICQRSGPGFVRGSYTSTLDLALFVDGIPALWTWLCLLMVYQRSEPGFVCGWYISALNLALFDRTLYLLAHSTRAWDANWPLSPCLFGPGPVWPYLVLAGPLHRDVKAMVQPAVLQQLGDGDATSGIRLQHAGQQVHHLLPQPLRHLVFAVLVASKTVWTKSSINAQKSLPARVSRHYTHISACITLKFHRPHSNNFTCFQPVLLLLTSAVMLKLIQATLKLLKSPLFQPCCSTTPPFLCCNSEWSACWAHMLQAWNQALPIQSPTPTFFYSLTLQSQVPFTS